MPNHVDPKKIQVKIRTDNGSQFVAKAFKDRLNEAAISNEYIQPGVPEQNGHIEAFHNTLNRLVCSKFYFENYWEAQNTLQEFFQTYNQKRIMKSILYCSPMEFMLKWSQGKIGWLKTNNKIKYFFREKPSESMPGDSFSEVFNGHYKISKLNNRCLTTP